VRKLVTVPVVVPLPPLPNVQHRGDSVEPYPHIPFVPMFLEHFVLEAKTMARTRIPLHILENRPVKHREGSGESDRVRSQCDRGHKQRADASPNNISLTSI